MLMLFDYDGVIVDSFDQLLDLCVKAQESMGYGRAPEAIDFQTIENLDFVSLGRLIGIPEEMQPDYSNRVFELQKENWSVSVFGGVVSVFRALATRNTLAVITASQTDAVTATLQSFGMLETISCVLGGECGRSKAQRIVAMQEQCSARSSDTIMVGDAISDIREGKRAGVKTVAVSWGFQNRELLAKEIPDFLIDRPDELLAIGDVTR